MHRKVEALFIGLVLIFSQQASAQETPSSDFIPLVSFAEFPMPLARTYVSAARGTPSTKAEMDSPSPNDYPPAVQVDFEDARPYTRDKPATYSFPSVNTLRVYYIGDVTKAPYKTIQPQIALLRKILKERPKATLSDAKRYIPFPDYPHSDSAHAFEIRVTYIDADWGSGICYMTVFTQDGSNHASNDELTYLVQGLSKDGQFYVAADFPVSNRRLAHFNPNTKKGDYSPDIKLLTPLEETSFVPSLPKLRQWLGTLKISLPRGD